MTRKKAEKIARGVIDKIECNTVDIDEWAEFWGFTREEYEEFLDTAIKALEQEPCEDCISRQAVCNIVDAIRDCISVEGYWAILERLKKLPSVNPQKPKTGHWILHPKGIYAHLLCDKCLSNAPYDCHTNYCPNCGAKMVDTQESEVQDADSN